MGHKDLETFAAFVAKPFCAALRLRGTELALLQAQHPVASGGDAGVVRGDDGGQPVLGVHLAQQLME